MNDEMGFVETLVCSEFSKHKKCVQFIPTSFVTAK